MRLSGHVDEAIELEKKLVAEYPKVGSFRSELGYSYQQKGDNQNAYASSHSAINEGVFDSVNFPTCGVAAVSIGKNSEAGVILQKSLDHYRDYQDTLRVSLGQLRYNEALADINAHHYVVAEQALSSAEAALTFVPAVPTGNDANQRRRRMAYVAGLQGDMAQGRGDSQRAANRYQMAYSLGSDLPGAVSWQQAAERLSAAK